MATWPPCHRARDIIHAIARDILALPERLHAQHAAPGARLRLPGLLTALTWLISISALAWALRLVYLEGYLYAIPSDFVGDFTRTANLGAPRWFTGEGMFYGPIFVLEYRFLVQPGILANADFARLDYLLFGIAFACTWLALIGPRLPQLCLFVLAAWLANHMSVEAFANTAHLEVLELALISAALLLAVRHQTSGSGAALGLAIATKTLPGLFLPYLAITRRWAMLGVATLVAGCVFLVVCAIQGLSPWAGLYALVDQSGNLTTLEYTEYWYTPRAEIARMLAGDGGVVTPEQARLAIGLHWAIAMVVMLLAAWVLYRATKDRHLPGRLMGLMFGLVSVVMLVVAPSAHAPYYIFLLPAWTAILAELLRLPWSARTLGLFVALIAAYVMTGFDQPFFLSQRLFGFGQVVPQHWLAWHFPSLGLLLTLGALTVLLLEARRPSSPAALAAEAR